MEADGRTWPADVGFGEDGLVEPIAFEDAASVPRGRGSGGWAGAATSGCRHVPAQRTTADRRVRIEDLPKATVEELTASLRDRLGIPVGAACAEALLSRVAEA